MPDPERYLIVTCDGGGIRGVITSMLLESVGQKILDNVNMYAGTSTGSLIALALAGGVPIEKLTKLYQSPATCAQIFSPFLAGANDSRRQAIAALERQLRSSLSADTAGSPAGYLQEILSILEQLLFPLYGSKQLRQLLEQNLPDLTIAELWSKRQKHLLVPTFWINASVDGKPRWSATAMHNLPGLSFPGDFNQVKLVDAMMASGAAPLYFEPHGLASGALFIDGGTFANNPSSVTLAALLGAGIIGEKGVPLDQVFLLSLGTGFNQSSYPPPDELLPPYGIAGWLWPKDQPTVPKFPLLSAIFDGVSQIDDFQAQMILGPGNYRRANLDLGSANIALDDCTAVQGANGLIARTKTFIKSPTWQTVLRWVQQNFA